MELPIDHFRLLGLSPSAEAESVLRSLQLRLDRYPVQGFTNEVLIQRAELLRLSADVLTNQSLRDEYEAALLSGASGLELSSNREVAGLILLWEADAPQEAFKLACKALQPPQTPALGSGREADLTLVAALSCRAASIQEQEQRRYQVASQYLLEGIQLLQRMGKLPEQRANLEIDLQTLLPYRILDLLSRDIGDQSFHQEGIRLLDSLVLKRGGLEGRRISKDQSVELDQSEFQLFFQQIRNYLTVQEQIDLFTRWQKSGSEESGFLAVLALTASGFSRRKPENIQEARKRLRGLNLQGIDQMPLLGCMDLLLADIDRANNRFESSSDEGLRNWLKEYPGDRLGAHCDYCRNWLRQDVLIGYRDIDDGIVDLEAWFADRDVQSYVERMDWKGAKGLAKASFSFLSSLTSDQENALTEKDNTDTSLLQGETSPESELSSRHDQGLSSVLSDEEDSSERVDSTKSIISTIGLKVSSYKSLLESLPIVKLPSLNNSSIVVTSLVLGIMLAFVGYRQRSSIEIINSQQSIDDLQLTEGPDVERSLRLAIEQEEFFQDSEKDELNTNRLEFKPLTDEEPNEMQVLSLVNTWLESKSAILSGEDNDLLAKVARQALVSRVAKERSKDKSRGEIQSINAIISSVNLINRTNRRIEVKADLRYSDQRVNSLGDIISQTSIPSLKVTYILGREKGVWKIVDYISGS